jgi:hypothetical protein
MDRTEEIGAGEAWAEEFVAEELAEVGGQGGRSPGWREVVPPRSRRRRRRKGRAGEGLKGGGEVRGERGEWCEARSSGGLRA